MKTKKEAGPMIAIGASAESVRAAREAIMDIIRATTAERNDVAVQALKTLGELCHVGNTTLNDCTMTMGDAR